MIKKIQISTFKLILIGQLFVNIPITIIIISLLSLLKFVYKFEFLVSLFLAVSIGWIYWEFAIRLWIKWALINKIDKVKLLDLGVRWKLLWRFDKFKIDKIDLKLKENS